MNKNDCEVCADITNQMNRIKGQVNGVDKMIKEGRESTAVLQQIRAIQAGLSRLGIEILKDESKQCFDEKTKDEKLVKFEELVANFFKIA